MAIVQPEGAGSKVTIAAFALKNSEFPIEMANEMESFFDEAWFGIAVLIWAFCRAKAHVNKKKQY